MWQALRNRTWRRDAGAAVAAIAVIAGIALLLLGYGAGLAGVVVGAAVLGVMALHVVRAASIDEQLDICDRGFRWSQPKRGGLREVRWEQVAELGVTRTESGRWGRAAHQLCIALVEGHPVLIDGGLQDFLRLVCYVEHGAHDVLRTAARRELRAHATIPFGALHLCRIGLVVDGVVIGWRRVADVDVEEDVVYVHLRDGRRLEAGPRSSIRSAYALISVIDELAGHAARLERAISRESHHRAAFT